MNENKLKILDVKFIDAHSDSVIARADIHFDGFTLKGFKVAVEPSTQKKYIMPPSYRSSMGWRMLFNTDSKEDWAMIQNRVLVEFENFKNRDEYFGYESVS